MQIPQIAIKRLTKTAVLPKRATPGSAGCDLAADMSEPVTIAPGQTAVLHTGIALSLPDETLAGFVFARSGLGVRHGICPANAVGVIDSDYRGEILVGLFNHSSEPYTVKPGERIAQLVILPVFSGALTEVEELEKTGRGAGGFSSTGR